MRACRRHCELLCETVENIELGKQNVVIKDSQVPVYHCPSPEEVIIPL